MSLPIDEMLDDLRDALEAFEGEPRGDTFAAIQYETRRIENCCEDELLGDEE